MYADFNYCPTGHLSRHGRAHVRALFIRARLTVNSISPRRYRGEIFVFFSPRARKRNVPVCFALPRAGATRVSARVYARGHSCAGTRPRLYHGHFLPAPPRVSFLSHSLSLSFFLYHSIVPRNFLPTPGLANATWCIGVLRRDALVGRINTSVEFTFWRLIWFTNWIRIIIV